MAVLLGLVVPPLGLLAWIALSGSRPERPNPNPIGLGLLLFAGGGLGTMLIAVGIALVSQRGR